MDFEIELCSILYYELDRRNLGMGFIIQQAKLLANNKYPTLKPHGHGKSGQQGKFNHRYCHAMLLRNGWKWPTHDFYLECDDDEDDENQELEFYLDKKKKITSFFWKKKKKKKKK